MSQSRDVRAKRCQSKEMSKQDVKAKGCQSKEMSKQRHVKAKGCQSLKGCQSKGTGSLARKPRFHTFHFQILRDVSHESFVFTSSTFRSGGGSRTKASFSHLPLSLFEGGLARKPRFYIFHVHFWRGVSHKSFVFTPSTFRFCTKASFSHTPLSDLEGGSRTKASLSHLPL